MSPCASVVRDRRKCCLISPGHNVRSERHVRKDSLIHRRVNLLIAGLNSYCLSVHAILCCSVLLRCSVGLSVPVGSAHGVRQNTAHKSVHTGKEAAIGPRTARLRGHAHTHFEPATDHFAVGARSGAALRSPTYPCGASGCGEAMRTVLMRRYCGDTAHLVTPCKARGRANSIRERGRSSRLHTRVAHSGYILV